MQGSYMYIKGTDIEVGITRVSYDPLYPYAMCTLRLGIKKKYLKHSSLKPISVRYLKIPYMCLSKYPSVKYNRLLYDAVMLPPDPSIEPLFQKLSPLREGKYEEAPLPHAALYEIVPTDIEGKTYYMHVLKPLNPTLAGVGKCRSFSIFGIPELSYRMKKYDSSSKIVTFDTSPIRRAHVSVLRQGHTMKHLGGHSYRWNHGPVSLKNEHAQVDWGWIAGTNIHVKTCMHHPQTSLYKWGKHNMFHWVPIEQITTQQPAFGSIEQSTIVVFPRIYVNGLPFPFEARAPINHPIHAHPVKFLHEQKEAYPLEGEREEQQKLSVVMITLKHKVWLAHVKNLTLEPRVDYLQYVRHRAEDKQLYVADYADRLADLKRAKVM